MPDDATSGMSDDTTTSASDAANSPSTPDSNGNGNGAGGSEGGFTGEHPEVPVQPFKVAPTIAAVFNVLSLDIIPVACLTLGDILFAFDSSFLSLDAAAVLSGLPGLRDSHKSATGQLPPLSLFGPADPVCTDDYNKTLSGRRVRAVYGALTNDVSVWKKLLNESLPGDDWREKGVLKSMRAATDQPDGASDDDTIQAYLAKVFPKPLAKTDFLGRGEDPNGVADFQGCSDFNPLLILRSTTTTPYPNRFAIPRTGLSVEWSFTCSNLGAKSIQSYGRVPPRPHPRPGAGRDFSPMPASGASPIPPICASSRKRKTPLCAASMTASLIFRLVNNQYRSTSY